MYKIYSSILPRILLFIAIFFPCSTAYAINNKPVVAYFTNNFVVQFLVSGRYYTFGAILVMLLVAWWNKSFRTIFFSVVMAIFGIFLLVFVFEAMDSMEWIPAVH